ncbi:hypothetical protein MA16_Dca006834 [Dendrobium catenatum]|uniref:Uncharacterized protein n=1 Tax=Dendrobium catenatum TaxID=906689 RepID=A0A2I0VSW5_9ASPA|nr:hypothetical protein MA16_Dca006834 [Dendrobium catenatum]
MAAEVRRTTLTGGLGDIRRPSIGSASILIRSLPAFGDDAVGISLNISAQDARLKMKNNKALVINEGGLVSTKKILPEIRKGKEIVDSSFKNEKSTPRAMDVI